MFDTHTLIAIGAALVLGAFLLKRASKTPRADISLGSISSQWLMDRRYEAEDR